MCDSHDYRWLFSRLVVFASALTSLHASCRRPSHRKSPIRLVRPGPYLEPPSGEEAYFRSSRLTRRVCELCGSGLRAAAGIPAVRRCRNSSNIFEGFDHTIRTLFVRLVISDEVHFFLKETNTRRDFSCTDCNGKVLRERRGQLPCRVAIADATTTSLEASYR